MGRNYSATAVDTTLSSAITASATNISVVATVGLPTAPFLMAIIDNPGVQEIVNVTGVNGTNLTIQRGIDGTVATPHAAGTLIRHVFSAIDAREASLHIDATTGVHGVGAGAVVGTTTVQTITNKNLTSGTNTFPTFITGYLVPTGAGLEWPSTAPAPAGYLKQDGGEYPIATYTTLYNFLTSNGTVFPFGANTNGAGAAGSTHFRTPARAGRVAVGYNASDSDFNAIGKTGGAKTHTLSIAEMPFHNHGVNDPGHEHGQQVTLDTSSQAGIIRATVVGGGGIWSDYDYNQIQHAGTGITIAGNGGGGAHNIMQPFTVMGYIIKT